MSAILLTDAPKVALPALTKTEAEAIAAWDGVMKRYRLAEWLRCRVCFSANREDGCKSLVTSRLVRITCRCGTREYQAPQGTTDLAANRANSALTLANQGTITVIDGAGQPVTLKSMRLEPEDAAIIRLYDRVMGELSLNPKVVHRVCWNGRTTDDAAMELLCNPSQVALRCGCSCFHYTGSVH